MLELKPDATGTGFERHLKDPDDAVGKFRLRNYGFDGKNPELTTELRQCTVSYLDDEVVRKYPLNLYTR